MTKGETIVWGRSNSINVQKVMWVVGEIGLKVDRRDVGGAFGGLDTPDYIARNPNSRVPTLEDDQITMWESNAVVRYLSARYSSGTLWPEDPAARGPADMWMDWCSTTLAAAMTTLFWGKVRLPEAERDEKAISAACDEASMLYKRLDGWLDGRNYVAGDTLTMGDVPVGAMAYRFMNLVPDRPAMPNVEAWYERLIERPAYREHVMLPLT